MRNRRVCRRLRKYLFCNLHQQQQQQQEIAKCLTTTSTICEYNFHYFWALNLSWWFTYVYIFSANCALVTSSVLQCENSEIVGWHWIEKSSVQASLQRAVNNQVNASDNGEYQLTGSLGPRFLFSSPPSHHSSLTFLSGLRATQSLLPGLITQRVTDPVGALRTSALWRITIVLSTHPTIKYLSVTLC